MQPIVNGVPVVRVVSVPWERDDDPTLDVGDGWRIVGRARVDFPQGGVANGLLVTDAPIGVGGPQYQYACVVWERPRDGGAGRFRMVPLGDWSSP